MVEVKCNQCGYEWDAEKGKVCPKCGDTLKDEVKKMVRKKIHLHQKSVAIIVAASLISLGLGWFAVDESRHYWWNEPKTSPITDKETHTHTQIHSTGGKSPHYYTTTYDDYHLYLKDGHQETVSHNEYDSYHVGQNYTYQILHRDWKPGMQNAPIPVWVYIVPVIVLAITIGLFQYPVMVKRQKEYDDWRETGDLNVDDD